MTLQSMVLPAGPLGDALSTTQLGTMLASFCVFLGLTKVIETRLAFKNMM